MLNSLMFKTDLVIVKQNTIEVNTNDRQLIDFMYINTIVPKIYKLKFIILFPHNNTLILRYEAEDSVLCDLKYQLVDVFSTDGSHSMI